MGGSPDKSQGGHSTDYALAPLAIIRYNSKPNSRLTSSSKVLKDDNGASYSISVISF